MESDLSFKDLLQSDQECMYMYTKPSSYFRNLNLERITGMQCGLEHEEKWLLMTQQTQEHI